MWNKTIDQKSSVYSNECFGEKQIGTKREIFEYCAIVKRVIRGSFMDDKISKNLKDI